MRRFLLSLAALAATAIPSAGQWFTTDLDSQTPDEVHVIPRVWEGNTPYLQFRFFQDEAPLNLSPNWSMIFWYSADSETATGVSIPGTWATSNTCQFLGHTNVFFSEGKYYWSVMGMHTTGYTKTWGIGTMYQDYDPATDTNLQALLGPINIDWWTNAIGEKVESNRVNILRHETQFVQIVHFNSFSNRWDGSNLTFNTRLYRLEANTGTWATVTGKLASATFTAFTNAQAATNIALAAAIDTKMARTEYVALSNRWASTNVALAADINTRLAASQFTTFSNRWNATNLALQAQIDNIETEGGAITNARKILDTTWDVSSADRVIYIQFKTNFAANATFSQGTSNNVRLAGDTLLVQFKTNYSTATGDGTITSILWGATEYTNRITVAAGTNVTLRTVGGTNYIDMPVQNVTNTYIGTNFTFNYITNIYNGITNLTLVKGTAYSAATAGATGTITVQTNFVRVVSVSQGTANSATIAGDTLAIAFKTNYAATAGGGGTGDVSRWAEYVATQAPTVSTFNIIGWVNSGATETNVYEGDVATNKANATGSSSPAYAVISNAFDGVVGNVTTGAYWAPNVAPYRYHALYDVGRAVTATQCIIYTRGTTMRGYPTSHNFLAANNSSGPWTELYSDTNAGWSQWYDQVETYDFVNETPYRYYLWTNIVCDELIGYFREFVVLASETIITTNAVTQIPRYAAFQRFDESANATVPYWDSNGWLTNQANFTYDGNTLTVPAIAGDGSALSNITASATAGVNTVTCDNTYITNRGSATAVSLDLTDSAKADIAAGVAAAADADSAVQPGDDWTNTVAGLAASTMTNLATEGAAAYAWGDWRVHTGGYVRVNDPTYTGAVGNASYAAGFIETNDFSAGVATATNVAFTDLTDNTDGVTLAEVTNGAALGATALQPAGNLTGTVAGMAAADVTNGATRGATAWQPGDVVTNATDEAARGYTNRAATALQAITNYVAFPAAANVSGKWTITFGAGRVQQWVQTGAITGLEFIVTSSNGVSAMTGSLKGNGSAVTWPTSIVSFASGSAPTITSNQWNLLQFLGFRNRYAVGRVRAAP